MNDDLKARLRGWRPYADEDIYMSEAADRIEQLEEEVAYAMMTGHDLAKSEYRDLVNEQEARIEELERERDVLKNASIIEIASRNNRVTEYMFHWEGRALDAEAKLAELERDGLITAKTNWNVRANDMETHAEVAKAALTQSRAETAAAYELAADDKVIAAIWAHYGTLAKAKEAIRSLATPEQSAALDAVIAEKLKENTKGIAEPCPCTLIEQDESCPVGYPSLLCSICQGTGNTTPDKITALACEMLKIASDLGETEDPFAAWEVIASMQEEAQLCEAIKAEARAAERERIAVMVKSYGKGSNRPQCKHDCEALAAAIQKDEPK